jgi:hypothetical protein
VLQPATDLDVLRRAASPTRLAFENDADLIESGMGFSERLVPLEKAYLTKGGDDSLRGLDVLALRVVDHASTV